MCFNFLVSILIHIDYWPISAIISINFNGNYYLLTQSEISQIHRLNSGKLLRHASLYYVWGHHPVWIWSKLNEGLLNNQFFQKVYLKEIMFFNFLTYFRHCPLLGIYRAYITHENTQRNASPMAEEDCGSMVIFKQF